MKSEDVKKNLVELSKMIIFFATNSKQRVYKTKLNKLLFYAQFLCYKTYGIRLLDFEFIHDYHGPVLKCLDTYLNMLSEANIIEMVETDYGFTVETPINLPKKEYFIKEFDILSQVAKRFRNSTAADISEYSHKEPLWFNTEQKCTIDINRANELNELFV